MGGQTLGQGLVAEGEHLTGQEGCVLCAVDADGGHGDARRHLNDAEQSVKTVQHAFDGHADDGQGGLCGDDARQCGGHSCGGNDDADAASGSSSSKLLHGLRRAVSRQRVHLKRHLQLVELLAGFLHDGQVAGAAHDNADNRFHILFSLYLYTV